MCVILSGGGKSLCAGQIGLVFIASISNCESVERYDFAHLCQLVHFEWQMNECPFCTYSILKDSVIYTFAKGEFSILQPKKSSTQTEFIPKLQRLWMSVEYKFAFCLAINLARPMVRIPKNDKCYDCDVNSIW